MSEKILSDGGHKPRSVLGDVTNQIGKRRFSLISISGVKSGDGYEKGEGVRIAKKDCLRVENFKKENSHKEIVDRVLRPHGCTEIKSLKGSAITSVYNSVREVKDPCPPNVRQNATSSSTAVNTSDVIKDSCILTSPDESGPRVTVEAEEDERTDSVVVLETASKEKVENSLGVDDGDDDSVHNLDLTKDEYLDCSRLLESQESRCGLERCVGQKGDGSSSSCIKEIKACRCSFCLKAAYIWSDLHYQDIKGRIAEIKKSQKEACILVQQNRRDGARGRHGEGNTEKCSNLESDLTGRCMSLLLHMEAIFVREGSQLERSLSILKELRDNCKIVSEKQ